MIWIVLIVLNILCMAAIIFLAASMDKCNKFEVPNTNPIDTRKNRENDT